MRSLLASLLAGLILSLVAVYGAQRIVVGGTLESLMEDYIAGELEQDADELYGSLVPMPGAQLQLGITHFDPAFLSTTSGKYYMVDVAGQAPLRSPSLGRATLTMPDTPRPAPGTRLRTVAPGPDGRELLYSVTAYVLGARRVTVAIATDLLPIRAARERLMRRYTWVSLATFVLLLGLQAAIVRLVFRSLDRVQDDVACLERGEIAQLGERVPAEVLPLVREVNRLLALLTGRLRRSREALGNVAHAMKTPLAVLTHMADDPRIRDDPELGPSMAQQLQLLRARVDSELRRARVAGGRAAGAPVDLAPEMAALADTLRKLFRDRTLAIRVDAAPGLQFYGDREDFLELAGNLLDNACKWARSQVLVTLREEGGALTLVVQDDGPGCPEPQLQWLGRRGARLDEDVQGHGLGLSIAGAIASSYGGTISYGRSDSLGGFQATVHLPKTSG